MWWQPCVATLLCSLAPLPGVCPPFLFLLVPLVPISRPSSCARHAVTHRFHRTCAAVFDCARCVPCLAWFRAACWLPRAHLACVRTPQLCSALALESGRDYVTFNDVQYVLPACAVHRVSPVTVGYSGECAIGPNACRCVHQASAICSAGRGHEAHRATSCSVAAIKAAVMKGINE